MDALSGAPPPFAFEHDLVRKPVTTFRDHAWGEFLAVAWHDSGAEMHRENELILIERIAQ
jgi:hypothetical protein